MNLRTLASAAGMAAIAVLPRATAAPLTLADLPALVLANDASAVSAARSVEAAYHGYRGTLADALPQVDLSTGYSLVATPATTLSGAEIEDYGAHAATTRVTLSQLLPTAGNLVVTLEDALSVTTIGSQTVFPFPATNPDPDFSQKPKASLSLAQPVMLNGKLVDFELFPATKRKAELGWEKEQAAERVATGRALAQAVQLYFTVIQQRRAVARLERTVELSQRRLETLGENVRLGITTETDLLDARIADGRQRQSLLDLRSNLARTERLLAAAIGRASLRDVELADGVPEWTRTGDGAGLREAALAANASIQQGSLAVEERAADEILAGQRFAANLTLSLSVAGRREAGLSERTFGQSFADIFAAEAGVDWTASANLAVPLYDGGSRREQKAASAVLTASIGGALESRRQAVLDDLAAALERRAILEERVALLAEAVDLATRRLADERSLLSLGRSTGNDVDARLIDVAAKENDLWRARADLLLANLDIASLAGDDLAGILEGLPPMKKRAWLVILVSLLVLAAAAVALNFTLKGSRYETAIEVRAHVVARGRLEDRVSGNGSFTPRTSITAVAQVSGEVETVAVREGGRVAAGQLLVRLRDDDYVLARDKARSSLDSARRGVAQSLVTLRGQYRPAAAALADAARALDRNRELYAAKSIAEETFQHTQSAYDSAELGLRSVVEQLNLRAGLDLDAEPVLDASRDAAIIERSPEVEQALLAVRSAEDSIRKCTVVSPIAGTVTMVKPSVGDLAAASTPLARVETLDDMLAEIQIDEVDVGKVRDGQAVEVTSDSLIGTTLAGTVESIAPTITTVGATRVSLVQVRITGTAEGGPRPLLRAGASCSARIRASIRQDVLLVPLSGFATEENQSHAFVLSPTGRTNRAGAEVFSLARREIRIGASDVTDVEVVEGLAEGDRVAIGSLKLLRDGVLVTVRAE